MMLRERVAVVTGAASGLGRQIALHLVREGAAVHLLDVDAAALATLRDAIGGAATFQLADVTREGDWIAALEQVRTAHGRLDILVNSAGAEAGPGLQDPEHVAIEEWRRVNAVNVEGIVLGGKHAIPLLARSGRGAIVNIASIAGCVATPSLAAYGASKAAVIHLTRTVAAYCARQGYGIRCNCVLPGVIVTPMMERFWKRMETEQRLSPAEARARFLARIPLGAFQEPEDIADAVLFLASDRARQITGVQLPVDGGLLLHDR
jgi:NAD(P)-dependent dehydrogenase (short-subunit alcohol dehydrogenase family)